MEQYLIDTNIISDYFSDSLPLAGISLMDNIIDAIPNLSVITQIELLSWNTDDETVQHIKNFIADSIVLGINPEVVAYCVSLRKARKIKTPDAIIAATALAFDFTLVTNNERDFANIKSLKLLNPHTL